MFTKSLIILGVMLFSTLGVRAENYQLYVTNEKDLNKKMEFLDKLYTCSKHKMHLDGSGFYIITGKLNGACDVKWSLVDCSFPEGVYQEFVRVQRYRVDERYKRHQEGKMLEIKDRNYRYLLKTGNTYCRSNYL